MGEAVTVFADDDLYITLRREAGADPFHLEDDLPPGALSEAELSVSIPGGAFPAFERASFVSTPSVTLNAPADPTGLSPESTFDAPYPADGHSAVYFSALQLGMNHPEALTFVACLARDDGDFSFPEETRTELQNASFTGGSLLEFSRLTTRLELSGDAALYLQTFRQTGYFLRFSSRP